MRAPECSEGKVGSGPLARVSRPLRGRLPIGDGVPLPVGGGGFGLLIAEHYSVTLLVLAAGLGNILGSCVNWFLAPFIARFEDRRWFPLSKAQVARAEGWYRRYGPWSLLLSWMPATGDPLTIVAGVLREPFPVSLALVAVVKTARFVAVAAITLGWF